MNCVGTCSGYCEGTCLSCSAQSNCRAT
jgi:hypothetical protein